MIFGRRKEMRKKNIARAGATFVLLLGLTGVTIFGQDTEATSRAETPRKVANVTKTKNIKKSNLENPEKKSEEKQSDGASSNVEKQLEDKKQETEKASATVTVIENKSESNSFQNNPNSENENQNKSENSSEKNTESTKPSHEHTWIPQKKGYEKKTLVKEAWTEYKPVYETVAVPVCNVCEKEISDETPAEHGKKHALAGEGAGHHTEYVQKQTGTEEIPHEAEYKTEWIEDIIGYKCSSCGATK